MNATVVNGRRVVVEVIDDDTAARFRAMTPAQRVVVASAMHREVHQFLAQFVRTEHPDWADAAVDREVLRMFEICSDGVTPPVHIVED